MNTGNRKNPRVVYREYTDSDGNVRTEYKDAKGNIYTEYHDALGNFHTDQQDVINNKINNKLADAHIQDARVDRADKDTSKGLLIGVIVTTVVGLVAGLLYFLNDVNDPQPTPIVSIPTEKVDTDSTPVKVVEKEVVKIVPVPTPVPSATVVEKAPETKAPEAKAPETKAPETKAPETKAPETNNNPTVTNNITVKPSESNSANPTPSTNKTPTAKPSETTAKPVVIPNNSVKAKNDGDLKNEILKTFQGNLPNNQLKVEVKNGEVIVSGNVETQEQMQQIQPLLTSIEGIKKVNVTASIEPKVTN